MSNVWQQWQQDATGVAMTEAEGNEVTGDGSGHALPDIEDGTVQATQAAITKAAELGVDLNTVTGTGLNGKITVPDVEAAAGD